MRSNLAFLGQKSASPVIYMHRSIVDFEVRLRLLSCCVLYFVILFLFFTYVIMLLNITYFSREPGSRSRLDLQLFSTWDAWPQSRAYFVENILLFLPFGCFLPIVWPQAENVLTLALSACMISIGIEMAQYITGRGYSQLDDIVTNTAGAVIGYLLFFITAKIIRLSRKRKEYRGKT